MLNECKVILDLLMGIKVNTRVRWQVKETESPNCFIVVCKQVGTREINQKRERAYKQ